MSELNKRDSHEYRRLLEEIGEDYCPRGTYCIFKEFIISAHPSRRLLVQLKCCDMFKYVRSQAEGSDIGWSKTMQIWVDEGHAKRFADCYSEDKPHKAIFNEMFPKG